MTEVFLSRRALIDIENILNYSTEKWGEKVADEYKHSITETLDIIKQNPSLLKYNKDISNHLRFYRIRQHFLVCDIIDKNIYVLALRHGSMDLPNRIEELEPFLSFEADHLHKKFLNRKND